MADTTLEQEQQQQAVELEYGHGVPDPLALTVAAELQAQLPDTEVLLFGSRAIGNWRPESDIDLAVIGGDRDAVQKAIAQMRSVCEEIYDRHSPYPQLFHFSRVKFAELRTSLPHVAGQVQRYGLKPNGERLPQTAQTNLWPKVKEELQVCARNLGHALRAWGGGDEDAAMFDAHGAIELAIKAVLVVGGLDLTQEKLRHHDLVKLSDRLPADQKTQLNAILPDHQLSELTKFRVDSPYEGEPIRPSTSAQQFVVGAQRTCNGLAAYALAALDKRPDGVGYDVWLNNNDALGGWATLSLDHFERVFGFRMMLKGILTDRQISDVEHNWARHGASDDAAKRIGTVMGDPSTWRDLFVKPAG